MEIQLTKPITLSPYTILGVSAGIGLGHFVFKSSSFLTLMAFGIAGGFLANKADKSIQNKILAKAKDLQTRVESNTQVVVDEVAKKSSFEGGEVENKETVSFDPRVGYLFPHGTIQEQNLKDTFDLDINN